MSKLFDWLFDSPARMLAKSNAAARQDAKKLQQIELETKKVLREAYERGRKLYSHQDR